MAQASKQNWIYGFEKICRHLFVVFLIFHQVLADGGDRIFECGINRAAEALSVQLIID